MKRPWFQDLETNYAASVRSRLVRFAVGVLIGGSIMLALVFMTG